MSRSFNHGCSKRLLHQFLEIYPGTTQILLTINVNTRLQSCELSLPLKLGMISSAIGVNRDTSYKSSSKCHCRDTSITIKEALNQSIPNTEVWFQPVCFNEDAITLHCNQSRVSILTSVISVYKLQVKVNRHNYNSYNFIYITWLWQSCYVLHHSWNRRN